MPETYMDYSVLGSMLQSARNAAGYSQKDVANWFGKTYQNISSWERGASKIDIDSLLALCEKYKIDFVTVLKKASNMKSTAGEVSITYEQEERKLIDDYRTLNDQGQEYIRQTMYMATQIYKKMPNFSDMEKRA